MITMRSFVLSTMLLASSAGQNLLAQEDLSPELRAFLPYINKTWKAPVGKGPDQQPIYDVSRWERALNGKAVRVLHSVANGSYGGESILMWDRSRSSIVFYYFTTAGFYTHGTTTMTETGIRNVEEVVGNSDGITQVESTSTIDEDGRMIVVSRMLKRGEWQEPERVVYIQDPDAEVIFR